MENVVILSKTDLVELLRETISLTEKKRAQFPYITEREAMSLLDMKDVRSFRTILAQFDIPAYKPTNRSYFYKRDDILNLFQKSKV